MLILKKGDGGYRCPDTYNLRATSTHVRITSPPFFESFDELMEESKFYVTNSNLPEAACVCY